MKNLKTWLIAVLLALFASILLLLSSCATRHKIATSEKTEVQKKEVSQTDSSSQFTDHSTEVNKKVVNKTEEYTEETTIHADSIKVHPDGSKTVFNPSVTNKKTGNKQVGKQDSLGVNKNINLNKQASVAEKTKQDSTVKKTALHKDSKPASGNIFWAIGFLVIVVLIAIYFIKKQMKKPLI